MSPLWGVRKGQARNDSKGQRGYPGVVLRCVQPILARAGSRRVTTAERLLAPRLGQRMAAIPGAAEIALNEYRLRFQRNLRRRSDVRRCGFSGTLGTSNF